MVALLAGCVTAYQPLGSTGGYRETPIGFNRYRVEFSGNGNTPKEVVWAYWVYRCAAFTRERGFHYFRVEPKKPVAGLSSTPAGPGDVVDVRWADFGAGDGDSAGPAFMAGDGEATLPGKLVGVKGSSGGSFITFTGGGGGGTRWISSGIVDMFGTADEAPGHVAFNADKVMATLKPFMDSQGKTAAPTSAEIAERSFEGPGIASSAPSASRAGPVTMSDLRWLIDQP